MSLRLSNEFERCLRRLSPKLQDKTKKFLKLLEENPVYPYHPFLQIESMQGFSSIYEGHVAKNCVFTFHKETDQSTGDSIIVLRKIGDHNIYKNP